jgi:hypothetical protein
MTCEEVLTSGDLAVHHNMGEHGIAHHYLPKNCIYVIVIGLHGDRLICKHFASSDNHHFNEHKLKYPGCRLAFIASFGTHATKTPEDAMKYFCKSNDLYVRVENETECFALPMPGANAWLARLKDAVVKQHGHKMLCCDSMDVEGKREPVRETRSSSVAEAEPETCVQVERERTKQQELVLMQKQCEVEILKLQLQLKE